MIYLTLVTFHLLSVVIWLGGMLFLGLVITPVLRGRPAAERAALLHVVGRRFLKIGWAALGVLVLSGIALWEIRAFQLTLVLTVKLGLVAVILLLSLLHDFVLGPALVAELQKGGEAGRTLVLRRRVSVLARLNVALALVVLILGLAFSRGFQGAGLSLF